MITDFSAMKFLADDRWSDADREAGEAYAAVCEPALARQLADLTRTDVALSDEKRAVVEVTALLDLAAKIAHTKLHLPADDFAMAALDVFMEVQP
jgi:hypothetical protein